MLRSGVHVRSIAALSELRDALGQFRGEVEEDLLAVEQEILRTLEWLDAQRDARRAELRRCEATVVAASRSLIACQSRPPVCRSDGRGGTSCFPPDCGTQQSTVRAMQRALSEAQAQLRNVEQWQKRVHQAVDAYRQRARTLRQIASTDIPKAQATLNRRVAALEAYVSAGGLGSASPWMAVAPELLSGFLTAVGLYLNSARGAAVREAKRQEIALVRRTGRGTRKWSAGELRLMQKKGRFPKGYEGHHINSVDRFPAQAHDPDNIAFVKARWRSNEHILRHLGKFTNASHGRMFNRKSLMVQWARCKLSPYASA